MKKCVRLFKLKCSGYFRKKQKLNLVNKIIIIIVLPSQQVLSGSQFSNVSVEIHSGLSDINPVELSPLGRWRGDLKYLLGAFSACVLIMVSLSETVSGETDKTATLLQLLCLLQQGSIRLVLKHPWYVSNCHFSIIFWELKLCTGLNFRTKINKIVLPNNYA